MKLPKIDIKGVATKAAGHAAGLALVTQLNRIPVLAKIDKPKTKGAITAAIGYLGVPLILSQLGFKGSKKGDFAGHVGDGVGLFGIAQLASNIAPNIFPKVSGVDGMDGVGYTTEEDVSGYEDQAVMGYEDQAVMGAEDEGSNDW